MLSTLLLSAFIITAMMTLIQVKIPALRLYFGSAAFSAFVILCTQHSKHYPLIYILVRAQETAVMLWLARPRWAALPGAIGLMFLACLGLTVTRMETWIALAEGTVFAFAGISLALRVKSQIEAVLAILWLLLAVFDFGFAMGMHLPAWGSLNLWWPTVLCIAVFGWIGIVLRKHGKVPLGTG